MPELVHREELFKPKSLSRRLTVQVKRLGLERLSYIGKALLRLKSQEKEGVASLELLPTIENPVERIAAFVQLCRAMDIIDNRRRILVGDPEPSNRPTGRPTRALLELEPTMPMPEPAVPQAEPGGAESVD